MDRPPARRWLPWCLGALAAVVYLLTLQRQAFDDGVFFVRRLEDGTPALNHLLFLPAVRFVRFVASPFVALDAEYAIKVTAALAGGAGVAFTFTIARDWLRSDGLAAAAALLLAALHGYWFHSTATELHSLHAACTAFLLFRLQRLVRAQRRLRALDVAALAAALAATPGSHLSGACVVLPLAFVWLRAGPARRGLVIAAAAGFAVFGAAYFGLSTSSGDGAGYNESFADIFVSFLAHPGRIPEALRVWAGEFGLYSLPAVTLVSAGLRVLRRSEPDLAMLCLLWMVAWSLISLPIEVRAVGSYCTPAFVVQAILAVVAMRSLAGGAVARAIAVAAVATAPAVLQAFAGEVAGLLALAAGAAVSWWMAREAEAGPIRAPGPPLPAPGPPLPAPGPPLPAPGPPLPASRLALRASLLRSLLPLCAVAVSLPPVLALTRSDAIRDPIREVARAVAAEERATGRPSLTIYTALRSEEVYLWVDTFPRAVERSFNPMVVALFHDEAVAAPTVAGYRDRIAAVLAKGGSLWLHGSVRDPQGRNSGSAALDGFLAFVDTGFKKVRVAGVATELYRLRPE